LQVSVFAPSTDARGIQPALEIVAKIADHFDGARLSGAGVVLQCGVPTPGPMVQEPGYNQFPVSIPFQVL
ncbi:MAG TPA: hypothetical protein VK150_06505, partial [Geothrix sp.]|nr:hypothetical protein [Geothrix sp.]